MQSTTLFSEISLELDLELDSGSYSKQRSINESDALIFSTGDHDLPSISILVAFSASVASPTFSRFVSQSNIFSCCIPPLHFPSIIPDHSSFSLLITWPKKVAYHLRTSILFMSGLVVSASPSSFL